jgi:tetratricopeptide (TPR) repeat protein
MRTTLTTIAFSLLAAAVSAQTAAQIEPYRNAVAAYVNGRDLAEAVAALQHWSKKDFESVRDQMGLRADARELQAAAVLHLEFGAAAVERFSVAAEWHLAIGAHLMEASTRFHRRKGLGTPEQLALQSTWLGVAASLLLSVNDAKRARWFINEALTVSPRSASLWTKWGALHELEAAVPLVDLWNVNILEPRSVARRNRVLVALESYQKAIQYDSGDATAHLRLGRALFILDRLNESREAIERAQQLATTPSVRYLAALTMGAVLEKRQDLPGARASYERALTIFPRGQTATVALGHLDVIEGRPDRAQETAEAFLTQPLNDVDWWEFKNGGIDRDGFEWLRRQVRR